MNTNYSMIDNNFNNYTINTTRDSIEGVYNNFNRNDIMIGILSIYYKMPFPFPKFNKIDAAELAKITGNYSSKELPLKITISEKKGDLIAQATGQSAFPLTFKEEKTFIFAPAGIEMIFGENSFVLKQGGMSFNFSKE